MNHLKSLVSAIAVFDVAYVGFASVEDIAHRMRRRERKKRKGCLNEEGRHNDCCGSSEVEEEEPFSEDELTEDTIRRAADRPAKEIVEDTIFGLPEVRPLLRCLKYEEMEAVEMLLSAYIGYLAENAPDEEQTFPVLMALLEATDVDVPLYEGDIPGRMLEESARENAEVRPERPQYLIDYRNYQVTIRLAGFVDKHKVLEVSRLIVRIVMVRLGIDYATGKAEGEVI